MCSPYYFGRDVPMTFPIETRKPWTGSELYLINNKRNNVDTPNTTVDKVFYYLRTNSGST